MKPTFQYKAPATNTGDLRTPIVFYKYAPVDSPEPGESKKDILHKCYAEAYNPSMKDLEILKTKETKEAVTIRIRDTFGEYIPTNKHFAEIEDYRYKDKVFNVVEVAPDLKDNRFIKIILGCYT